MNETLTESSGDDQPSTSKSDRVGTNSEICSNCHPVLSRYKDTFKSMKKQGSSLKKVKRLNPVPKRATLTHYRDLKGWLWANMFDSWGNYLYYAKCIRMNFGISKQCLKRRRKMKQNASEESIVEMTKAELKKSVCRMQLLCRAEWLWWSIQEVVAWYCSRRSHKWTISTQMSWFSWYSVEFS